MHGRGRLGLFVTALPCVVWLACGGGDATLPPTSEAGVAPTEDARRPEAPLDAQAVVDALPVQDAAGGDSAAQDAGGDAGPPADGGVAILERARGFYAVSKVLQAPTPPPTATIVDRAFIYAGTNYTSDVYSPTTAVDGVLLRFAWDALEPTTAGVYDFRQVLYETKKAALAGKKIQISISSGTMAPEWLCPSVDALTPLSGCAAGPPDATHPYCFRSYDGAQDGANCRCRVTPVPWAPEVRTPFGNMLRALRAALLDVANGGLTPAQFEKIALVRANGINYQTEELKLSNGAASCGTDVEVPAAWARAPSLYTADKLVSTWEDYATLVLTTFPTVATSAATTLDSFPRDATRPATSAYILGKLQAAMVTKFTGRHLLQVNALSPTFNSQDLFAARDAGVPIAFQTNTWLGQELGATCGMASTDPTLCVDKGAGTPSYFDLLNRGLCKGGNYIEVFAADVGRYPRALTAARALPFGVGFACP